MQERASRFQNHAQHGVFPAQSRNGDCFGAVEQLLRTVDPPVLDERVRAADERIEQERVIIATESLDDPQALLIALRPLPCRAFGEQRPGREFLLLRPGPPSGRISPATTRWPGQAHHHR